MCIVSFGFCDCTSLYIRFQQVLNSAPLPLVIHFAKENHLCVSYPLISDWTLYYHEHSVCNSYSTIFPIPLITHFGTSKSLRASTAIPLDGFLDLTRSLPYHFLLRVNEYFLYPLLYPMVTCKVDNSSYLQPGATITYTDGEGNMQFLSFLCHICY